MAQHLQRSIENHAGTRPPHDLTHTLTLSRGIAMTGTALARRLLVLPTTMVKTVMTIVDQRAIFLRGLLLMKMVTAIELYHKRDGMLFPVDDFSHNAVLFY